METSRLPEIIKEIQHVPLPKKDLAKINKKLIELSKQ
jgi:hypothetical protein